MAWRNLVRGVLLIAVGVAASGEAAAHGWGRGYGYYGPRVGIGIAVPLGGYGYYPGVFGVPVYPVVPRVYAPPPAVVVTPPTTVYVERGSPDSAASDAGGYWYYCRKPRGYYPYVKRCPDGWERVAPEPPDR
jgi:hypothetical protein